MKWMKKVCSGSAVAASAAALALLVMAAPEAGAATTPTSAGATVYNKVTVTYASGTVPLTASSAVRVTITTLAARPTLTVDSQIEKILSGANHLYTYTIKSNSNGTDTYTVSKDASSADTNMTTPNTDSLAATPIVLWGGYAIGSSSDADGAYITVPGGTTAAGNGNPLAVNATLMLTVNGSANQTYKVTKVVDGSAPADSKDDEVLGKIYLTPLNSSVPLTNVALGTQVGEYKTFTNQVTAGNVYFDPASQIVTDGSHVTYLHVVTAATDATKATVAYTTNGTDVVTTTILAPKLSIVKESRNYTVNPAGAFVGTGTTARPGEIVQYRITITNLHDDSSAIISNANVADSLPTYSSYVAGSTTISYNGAGSTKIDDAAGNVSPLAGSGYTLGTPLAGKNTAVIIYQATVN